MKGLEKLNFPRLAKVLGQGGQIPNEVLAEALRESGQTGMPFPDILLRDGLLSEWDLVRIVSQEFTLPILFPSSYSLDKEMFQLLPVDFIRKHRVIPIDRFGDVIVIAMPVLLPAAILEEIESITKLQVFPFVSPKTEIQKILGDRLPKLEAPAEEVPAAAAATEEKAAAPVTEEDWQKLFDEADQAIKKAQGV